MDETITGFADDRITGGNYVGLRFKKYNVYLTNNNTTIPGAGILQKPEAFWKVNGFHTSFHIRK